MTPNWRTMTPAEVLDAFPALTLTMAAYCTSLVYSRGAKQGEPNRDLVIDRVRAGKLRVSDPTVAQHRWTISADEVRRYNRGA